MCLRDVMLYDVGRLGHALLYYEDSVIATFDSKKLEEFKAQGGQTWPCQENYDILNYWYSVPDDTERAPSADMLLKYRKPFTQSTASEMKADWEYAQNKVIFPKFLKCRPNSRADIGGLWRGVRVFSHSQGKYIDAPLDVVVAFSPVTLAGDITKQTLAEQWTVYLGKKVSFHLGRAKKWEIVVSSSMLDREVLLTCEGWNEHVSKGDADVADMVAASGLMDFVRNTGQLRLMFPNYTRCRDFKGVLVEVRETVERDLKSAQAPQQG